MFFENELMTSIL